ncbi:methylated-DNA--[protein]-cysteine S-methyltransferase [Zoogloea sp.]|uniref:methylated-DNA--[protein]-cysteine S-methyltransferase n=1 Tax=Zoogloea sp. TaxID=49181 RepID=UPI0035AE46AE
MPFPLSHSSGAPVPQLAAVMPTPFSRIGVSTLDGYISHIAFLPTDHPLQSPRNALAEKCCTQIERYAQDPDTRFDLPLLIQGSLYRRRIWAAIVAIPRGQTRTYGDIAKDIRSIPRAVGQACGDNPFPLVIPCHRVVTTVSIGGFAHNRNGFLIDIKRWLLIHEGNADPLGEIQRNLFETPPNLPGQPTA